MIRLCTVRINPAQSGVSVLEEKQKKSQNRLSPGRFLIQVVFLTIMIQSSNCVFVEVERFPDMLATDKINAYFELACLRIEVQLTHAIVIALPTYHFEVLR